MRFKDGLDKSVENYDHLPLPPIYNQVKKLSCQRFFQRIVFLIFYFQVVNVATYAYFLLALVGYQELSSEPEMFFPFFLVLKFTFFIGLLKVSAGFSI